MKSTEKSYQILVGGSISDDPRGHRDIRPQSDPRKYNSMEIDIVSLEQTLQYDCFILLNNVQIEA